MSAEPTAHVSIFAVVRAEPAAQLRQMVAACDAQDWPGALDLVIAAPPEDEAVVRGVLNTWARGTATFVANPGGRRTTGLNRAALATDAPHLVRVDARSRLCPEHVRVCIERLEADPSVGVVGGVQWPAAAHDAGVVERGIELALRNPWLLGGAAYRRPGAQGRVDTVYLGAFRRDELLEFAYDEALDGNEDFELCDRYRSSGRSVWLEDGLMIEYRPRTSLSGLATQYGAFGASKVAMWRHAKESAEARQLVAVSAAALGVAAACTQITRPRRLAAGALALAAVYAVSDGLAVDGNFTPGERVSAVAAHGVTHAAWITGIVRQVLTEVATRL